VVIGAGPSGEGCCDDATKNGKRVAIVEDKNTVAANCTHWGPSFEKPCVTRSSRYHFNTNQMFPSDIGEAALVLVSRVLQNAQKVNWHTG